MGVGNPHVFVNARHRRFDPCSAHCLVVIEISTADIIHSSVAERHFRKVETRVQVSMLALAGIGPAGGTLASEARDGRFDFGIPDLMRV